MGYCDIADMSMYGTSQRCPSGVLKLRLYMLTWSSFSGVGCEQHHLVGVSQGRVGPARVARLVRPARVARLLRRSVRSAHQARPAPRPRRPR